MDEQNMYANINVYNTRPTVNKKLSCSEQFYETVSVKIMYPLKNMIYLMTTEGLDEKMARSLDNLYSQDIFVDELGLEHLQYPVLLANTFEENRIHIARSVIRGTNFKRFNLMFPPVENVAKHFGDLINAHRHRINDVNVRTAYLYVMNDLINEGRSEEVEAFHTLLWKTFCEMLYCFPYIGEDRKWKQANLKGDIVSRLYFAGIQK
ncbi:hypothetical protein BD770DRAFT_404672 [Pilaira anomala]|nr:hypothetical protein BD770DRAFT_404672 [Pilaira anomala]